MVVCGILLVLVFMGFTNFFDVYGMFMVVITLLLVVVLILGLIWCRYTMMGALVILVGGTFLILFSI